ERTLARRNLAPRGGTDLGTVSSSEWILPNSRLPQFSRSSGQAWVPLLSVLGTNAESIVNSKCRRHTFTERHEYTNVRSIRSLSYTVTSPRCRRSYNCGKSHSR